MKLGDGNIKYKIKFKYADTNRTTIKNVYANNKEEALKIFKLSYKDYKIEIIEIVELGGLNNE